MDMVACVQIVDKAMGILHSVNTLGKGMNQSILLTAIVNSRVDWTL